MAISKKDLKMLQLKQQDKYQKHLKACREANHAIPQTRRQFLASGLISMTGYMALPSIIQLISQSAAAADVTCGAASGGLPAYINIQLAGGPALFANFVPQGNGGTALETQKLGIGTSPTIRELFKNNAPFWFGASPSQGESKMVRALTDILGSSFNQIINQNSAFVGIAAESTDDREGVNPQDISGMLEAAGLIGTSLPYLLTGNKRDFLNRPGAKIRNRFKGALLDSSNHLIVENLASLEASIGGYPGVLGSTLTLNQQKVLVKAVEDLSKKQIDKMVRNPASSESQTIFKNLVTCAVEKNTEALNDNSNVDIYSDSTLASIWDKTRTSRQTAEGVGSDFGTVIERCGLVVGNCLRGLSGSAAINLGGFDYHLAFLNRNEANSKDYEFGDILGRVLLTAQALNRKTFIHVSTDGSLSFKASSDAFVNWGGDNPKKSMGYIIAYDPTGAPDTAGVTVGGYADLPHQLNHFNDNATVDNVNPIGSLSSQDLCAAAVFLNYLNFAGQANMINNANLAAVKAKLEGSLPAGAGSIFNYFTRIKG